MSSTSAADATAASFFASSLHSPASNAFFATSLASTLTSLGVDTLLIAGVSTSGCVRATAVDACQHGFIPLVVRDAVGDRHPAPHEANLFDLQAKYAEVISLEAAQKYLAGLKQA
jgi:nicotinamidase-related amidase